MSKRHPRTKEILAEMEKWAKKKVWPECPLAVWHDIEECLGIKLSVSLKDWAGIYVGAFDDLDYEDNDLSVIHFLPTGCKSTPYYAYCARPGVGKVIKHKIGNCPLAKEPAP